MTTPAPTDPSERQTRAALDAAVRAHAADKLDPGELIVNWAVVAGTRNVDGGGYVITMTHDTMPRWELEGILGRAVKLIDADECED